MCIMMITDVCFQDTFYFKEWWPFYATNRRFKEYWMYRIGGYAFLQVRIIVFWVGFLGGSIVSAFFVFSTGKGKGDIVWTDTTFGGISEVSRAMLAVTIVCTDLLTVAQDWDYPSFQNPTVVV